MNTSIADKVTRSKTLPHNLQQCFEKALEYEASFQLSEGVNMACKTTIMNINIEEDDEVNFVKDARARSNACFKCGKMGHFQWDCQYNGDKPSSDSQTPKQTAPDSYDPVVGKWMTWLLQPLLQLRLCRVYFWNSIDRKNSKGHIGNVIRICK